MLSMIKTFNRHPQRRLFWRAQPALALVSLYLGLSPISGAARGAEPSPNWSIKLEEMAHPTAGKVVVIAHRSCWKDTTENSLAGVGACIAMGVDGVEFDVRHSRDGVAVVMHDETVDRTTNGHGRVSDLTLAQLKALRLKQGAGGDGAALTDQTVPTLKDYLYAARGKLWLVFDVKDGSQAESFEIAKAVGVQRQAIFFYECRNDYLLNKIKSFWDEVVVFPIRFQADGPLSAGLDDCPSRPARLIHTKWTGPGYLEAASGKIAVENARVWIATMFPEDVAGNDDKRALLHPEEVWGAQIRAGANMIMTNEPEALLQFLGQSGARQSHRHASGDISSKSRLR
jgi:glycerophosphoryl diester phosphodiesterase